KGCDLVFFATPNGVAMSQARALLEGGARIVDFSADFRLKDRATWEKWYKVAHASPELFSEAVYGLPEINRERIRKARLVANPGCYATASLLALAPLADVIDTNSVVVDAKSGVSGAGRGLKASSHAGFVLENLTPYRVGDHQHAPEIEQALGFPVCFVPHLLPVRRGLLATCYVRTEADARALLEETFAASPAVRVLEEGLAPDLSRVQHTDAAEIAVYEDRATGRTIVACAIDNLGKGAAGNAVQNANVALGFEETAGLRLTGVLV
ncbi:MAG: N-acetyl-gamma-glutamyl-phosphate reductase, partial [Gaiellaceae bacterium]